MTGLRKVAEAVGRTLGSEESEADRGDSAVATG
jgi:hypothetical protein